jgi:hypothetical protein
MLDPAAHQFHGEPPSAPGSRDDHIVRFQGSKGGLENLWLMTSVESNPLVAVCLGSAEGTKDGVLAGGCSIGLSPDTIEVGLAGCPCVGGR